MVVRDHDQTNKFALDGIYGTIVVNEICRLPNNALFFDIGANAGIFTLIAARHLTAGEVFAFEPNRAVFRDLLENIDLNGFKNVTALNVALGNKTSLSAFAFPESHTGRGRLGDSDEIGFKSERVIELAVSDLADIKELAENRPCAAKIDTEGYEHCIVSALFHAGWLETFEAVVVEINAEHHMQFGASVADTYNIFEQAGLKPIFGQKANEHYDEVFRKAP